MLKPPKSGYYPKRARKTTLSMITDKYEARIEQETSLLEKIKKMKLLHLVWSYRRVRAYLKTKLGISISYNRIYRIMKKDDLLVDKKRYKAKRTPQKEKPRLVKINQRWGTDMTKFMCNLLVGLT